MSLSLLYFPSGPVGLFSASFLLSLALTYLVKRTSLFLGFVTHPSTSKEVRWSSRSVALGGGVSIQLVILLGMLLLQPKVDPGLTIAFTLIFLAGLSDDIWSLSPIAKLIFQIIAASYVVSQGFILAAPESITAMVMTVLWIVGITNALNLIDNMDGLAAGVSSITALGFFAIFHAQSNPTLGGLSLILAGASCGFLVHNFYPAKIFMGDAGSLPLGFLLACLSTQVHFSSDTPSAFIYIPLIFLLVVPIFDMLLVIASRRNVKKPVTSGGRDHTSHRLVALGLTERRSVLMLYALGILGAITCWALLTTELLSFIIISIFGIIILVLIGTFLTQVAVYPEISKDWHATSSSGFYGPQYLPTTFRYVLELAIDLCTVSVAWTLAHWIRFYDMGLDSSYLSVSLVKYWPYLIACKFLAFAPFKLYRGLWDSVLSYDVYRIFKASALGSLLLVLVLTFFNRFQDLSRLVILLDFFFTFVSLLGTRAALGAFRRWTRKLASHPMRAAFLGSPSLEPQIKEAIRNEKKIEFSGTISTYPDQTKGCLGLLADLEKIIDSHKIHVLFVENENLIEDFGKLVSKGLSTRRVKIILA